MPVYSQMRGQSLGRALWVHVYGLGGVAPTGGKVQSSDVKWAERCPGVPVGVVRALCGPGSDVSVYSHGGRWMCDVFLACLEASSRASPASPDDG